MAEGALLPTDVSSKFSYFISTQLGAGYNWRVNDPTVVSVGYDWATTSYTDISGFDAQTHTGYATVQYRVRPAVILGARLSGTMQLQDLDRSITQIQLSPSAAYRWNGNNVTELGYSISENEYATPGFTQVLERDGTTHAFTASHRATIAPLNTDLRIGLYQVFNDADGRDFDYSGTGGFLALRTALPWDFRANASVTRTVLDYDHPNSLAGAGFSFSRRDTVSQFVLGASRPLPVMDNRTIELYVRFMHNDTESNIGFYDYDQQIYSGGVRAQF